MQNQSQQPRSWSDVASDEQFQALAPEQQERARQLYFDDVVLPRVPQGMETRARELFDQDTAGYVQPIDPQGVDMQGAEAEGGVRATDYAKELTAGVLKGVGAISSGLGDMVRPDPQGRVPMQTPKGEMLTLGDFVGKHVADPIRRGLAGVVEGPASAVGGWLSDRGEAVSDTKSPAGIAALEGSTPQGDILKPSTWDMGESPSASGYGLHLSGLAGQFIPQAAAMLATRGKPVQTPAMMGVGGLQAGGAAGDEVMERLAAVPDTVLQEDSTLYRELRQSHGEEEARQQLVVVARNAAFEGAAPVGALGGLATQIVLGPLQGVVGGSIGRRLAVGAAFDAPAEAAQEVTETVAARASTNKAIGEQRSLTEDTLADAVLGAMGGAGQASVGAVFGRPDRRQGEIDPEADATFENTPDIPALPAPEVEGLPAPDQIFYGGADGVIQDAGPVINVDGEMQPSPLGRQWVNPANDPARLAGGSGMDQQGPAGSPVPIEGEWQRGTSLLDGVDYSGNGLIVPRQPEALDGDIVRPALPGPDSIVVDSEGNAQRGPVEPLVYESPEPAPADGRGMDQQAPTEPRAEALARDNDILLRKDGQPFQGRGSARASIQYRQAMKDGKNPTVVRQKGGWGIAIPKSASVGMRPVDVKASEAAASPDNDLPMPTQAQIEAGNYKKGHVRVDGLDIAIENPRGSERSGTDPDGNQWRHTMSDHYGYIKRTKGADGEHVDVYIGPEEGTGTVYVVDQLNQQDGSFDEHKAMIGYPDQAAAVAAYQSNFDENWKVGEVTEMPASQFRQWLKDGDTKQPLSAKQSQAKPVLQNRDRSTPASIAQMQSIAADPDYGRLGFSRDFASGAPVVEPGANIPAERMGRKDYAVTGNGRRVPVQYAVLEATDVLPSNNSDGTANDAYASGAPGQSRAIAGNGRVAGLQRAYKNKVAGDYMQSVMGDAELHGINPDAFQGMKQPVLVRVMPQEEVSQNIGDESNTTGTAALSGAEQATNDARRIDLEGMRFDEDGQITEETVRQFVRSMPKSEQAGLLDGARPSRQAHDRLASAVFSLAYESDALTRLQAQAADPEIRNVMSGLLQAAPKMARLKDAGDLDIRPLITEAAEVALNARRQNMPLAQYVEQMDISRNPEIEPILRVMASSARSAKRLSEQLGMMADSAYAETSKPDADMFGATPKRTRAEIIGEQGNDTRGAEIAGQPAGQRLDDSSAERGGADASRPAVSEGVAQPGREAGQQAQEGLKPGPRDSQQYRKGEADGKLVADSVKQAIKGMPELSGVEVVQRHDDLPAEVRAAAKRDGISLEDIQGVHRNGKSYLVAGAHDSVADALATAVHEEVGHRGIRGVLGVELDSTMDRIYTSFSARAAGRPLISEIRESHSEVLSGKSATEQRRIIAEELVAHMAETGQNPTVLQRAVSKIKEVLRKAFPQIPWSNTDVLSLIGQARQWLVRTNGSAVSANASQQYSLRGEKGVSPQDLAKRLQKDHPGLKLDLLVRNHSVTLSRIVLPSEARNSGVGTKVMQEISAWADANGKTVSLTASADFGGGKTRLTKFYKRFGFIENKGRARDFEISEGMYRYPSGSDSQVYSLRPDRKPRASEALSDLATDQEFVPKGSIAPAETAARRAQRILQDKLNRFTVISEWLAKKGITLPESADVYRAEERMHSRFSNKAKDFREKTVLPLVKKIQAADFTMDQVAQVLHAQHATERNAQIRKINPKVQDGSGMDDATAKAIMASADKKLVDLANEFRGITDQTRDILLKSGLIDRETSDAWQKAYRRYVPLKGGPQEKAQQQGTGKGLSVSHKTKRALGHDVREEGEFIIENILADHERALMLSEKNLVGQHLLRMAVEIKMPELMTVGQPEKRAVLQQRKGYEVLYRGAPIGAFSSREAANLHKANSIQSMGKSAPSDFTIRVSTDPSVVYTASPMPGPNEALVHVDGQMVRIQINDDLLARAYNNLGADHLGTILQAGRALNNWFSRVYTGYSPEFIITNLQRDFTSGLINISGQEGVGFAAKAMGNYARSFKDLLAHSATGNEGRWVKMYREDGGNTGAAYMSDLERLGRDVVAEYDAYKGLLANVRDKNLRGAARSAGRQAFNKSIRVIEIINEAGENAMRLAVYRSAIESDMSRNHAASLSKNVTVNFNRKGEMGSQLNALFLFFNAGVQGSAAIGHALFKGKHKYHAWGLSSALAGLGWTMSMLSAGGDEDEYEKLSAHVRERNLVLSTGDGWATIPMPYGHGFFWNLGRIIGDGNRTGEWGSTPWHLAASLVEETTPFGGMVAGDQPDMAQALLFGLPTAAQVPGAVAFNRTSFGGELYPESAFDGSQPDRLKMYRGTTGTWADTLSGALEKAGMDVSPETLKYLNRTFAGGAGNFVGSGIDAAVLAAQGASPEAGEIPFVRRAYRKNDVRSARARFWGEATKARTATEAISRAEKAGDADKYVSVVLEKSLLSQLDELAGSLQESARALRDESDRIRMSKTLSAKEKREAIGRLEKVETELYDEYISVYKEQTREK